MKIFKSMAIAFVLLVAIPWSAPAWAQNASSGSVLGMVTDQTGAVVAKAEVRLTNTATNATAQAVTNNNGQYVFPEVEIGRASCRERV